MKITPLPKTISNKFFDSQMLNVTNEHFDSTNEGILDPERNIVLVQWAQFIEHDLAKTVFQTMCKYLIYHNTLNVPYHYKLYTFIHIP